ncbi:MAG: hypothetical protein LBE04_08430, partial [Prevotellaceae bacterium]|nr:hypothetical protein [Prevotellaceae bacterium]
MSYLFCIILFSIFVNVFTCCTQEGFKGSCKFLAFQGKFDCCFQKVHFVPDAVSKVICIPFAQKA